MINISFFTKKNKTVSGFRINKTRFMNYSTVWSFLLFFFLVTNLVLLSISYYFYYQINNPSDNTAVVSEDTQKTSKMLPVSRFDLMSIIEKYENRKIKLEGLKSNKFSDIIDPSL